MTQHSSVAIYADFPIPSPLPGFNAMFKFTKPPDAAAQQKGMGLQFNLLPMKHWIQPTLYLLGNPLQGWTPVCFNTDVSDAEEKLMFPNSEIAYYLVGMTTDVGYDVGAPTS